MDTDEGSEENGETKLQRRRRLRPAKAMDTDEGNEDNGTKPRCRTRLMRRIDETPKSGSERTRKKRRVVDDDDKEAYSQLWEMVDGEQIAIVKFHEPTKDFQKRWEAKRQEARERGLKEVTDLGIAYKARAPHSNMAKESVRGEMREELTTHGERLQYYHEMLSEVTRDVDEDSETHVRECREWTEEELAEIQRVNEQYRQLNEETHQDS